MLNNYIFSIYIHCAPKNTKITITNNKGNTIHQISTNSIKVKDFRKNSPFILETLSQQVIFFLKSKKIKFLKIKINGIGLGRYHFLKKILKNKQIKILSIEEKTFQPFNGCRSKKQVRK